MKARSIAMSTIHPQYLPNGASFDLIQVEGGSFFIDNSTHEIHVPTFYMAKYPVTQALWQAVMGEESPSYFKGANRPVERVSWYDAAAFCNALNGVCGFLPRYFADKAFTKALDYGMTQTMEEFGETIPVFTHPTNPGYRLPAESAWEYAATGAQPKAKYEFAGGNNLDEVGWYEANSHDQTQPVGIKLPNELGIHDLSGNVWEWCEDEWQSEISKIPGDGSAWQTRKHDVSRVFRGGSWFNFTRFCRSSSRFNSHPTLRDFYIGFRVVCSPQSVGLFNQKSP